MLLLELENIPCVVYINEPDRCPGGGPAKTKANSFFAHLVTGNGKTCIAVFADRNIYPGEEILLDYGPHYDRSHYSSATPVMAAVAGGASLTDQQYHDYYEVLRQQQQQQQPGQTRTNFDDDKDLYAESETDVQSDDASDADGAYADADNAGCGSATSNAPNNTESPPPLTAGSASTALTAPQAPPQAPQRSPPPHQQVTTTRKASQTKSKSEAIAEQACSSAASAKAIAAAKAAVAAAVVVAAAAVSAAAAAVGGPGVGAAGTEVPATSAMSAEMPTAVTSVAVKAKAKASESAGVDGAELLAARARAAAPPKRTSPKITTDDNPSPAGNEGQTAGFKTMIPGQPKEFPAGMQPRHAAGFHGMPGGLPVGMTWSQHIQQQHIQQQQIQQQQAAMAMRFAHTPNGLAALAHGHTPAGLPPLAGYSPLAGFGGFGMPGVLGMPGGLPVGLTWSQHIQQQHIQQQHIQQQQIQQQQAAMAMRLAHTPNGLAALAQGRTPAGLTQNAGLFAANPLGIPWGSVGLGGLGGLVRGLGGLQPSPQLMGLSLEIQKQQLARH